MQIFLKIYVDKSSQNLMRTTKKASHTRGFLKMRMKQLVPLFFPDFSLVICFELSFALEANMRC